MQKKIIFFLLLFTAFSFAGKRKKKECFVKTCITCESTREEADDCNGKTFFSIRPQDSNTARRILNQTDKLGYCDDKVGINFTFQYQSSFDNDNLAHWILADDRTCLSIGVPGQDIEFDIDARQIGVGNATLNEPGLLGKVCFDPKIENFIVDADFLFNLSSIACGLWLRLDLPLVIGRTTWGICSKSPSIKPNTFPDGYFTLDCTKTESPYNSALDALLGNESFGEIPALNCGKFYNDNQRRTALAGMHFELGYDFIRNNCGNFGIYLHAVAPTGTTPNAHFLFSPVIGANRSWQVGLGINGSVDIQEDCYKSTVMYIDAMVTHLFKAKQTRLFALKNNGPLSWLLLLKRFTEHGDQLIGADRVGNVLCGETKIGADAMVDGSIMFQFNYCDAFFNVGYNLWFRTAETRDDTVCFRNFTENGLALKGNLFLSNPMEVECPPLTEEFCKPNMKTASQSTISEPGPQDECQTFLQINDIDFNAPLHPFAMSHKVFATLGYNWKRCNYNGFIQIGGEAEFSHKKTALSQWGVIFSLGFSF